MPFAIDFRTLTGFAPLCWQTRLYREHFAGGELPLSVDGPTGLGKTSVIALWLIARARGARLPRRLVYVVDWRAVVDQATDEACQTDCSASPFRLPITAWPASCALAPARSFEMMIPLGTLSAPSTGIDHCSDGRKAM